MLPYRAHGACTLPVVPDIHARAGTARAVGPDNRRAGIGRLHHVAQVRRSPLQPLHDDGFSLIELLVVLALAGLLSAIAVPSYRRVMLNNQRAEGRAALLQTAVLQERFNATNRSYAAFGGGAPAPAGFRAFSGSTAADSAYRIDAMACEGQTLAECVRIIATPQGFDDAVCGVLGLDSLGRQTAGGTAGAAPDSSCWPS